MVSVHPLQVARTEDLNGRAFYAVEVKSCVRSLPDYAPDGVWFTWEPWRLIDKGKVVRNTYVGLYDLEPLYPQSDLDGKFAKGDCVEGWIPFSGSKAPRELRYKDTINGQTVRWKIS